MFSGLKSLYLITSLCALVPFHRKIYFFFYSTCFLPVVLCNIINLSLTNVYSLLSLSCISSTQKLLNLSHMCDDPEMASDGNRAQDPTMWRDRLFTSGYFSIHSSLQFSLSSFCLYPSVSFSLPFLHYLLTPINVTQGIRVSGVTWGVFCPACALWCHTGSSLQLAPCLSPLALVWWSFQTWSIIFYSPIYSSGLDIWVASRLGLLWLMLL